MDRSPRYPAVSLTDAIVAIRSLWDKEKRTPVNGEVLAKALGYKSHSGPARTMIGALRQYGLLEKHATGLRVSDVAMRILHSLDGTQEKADAIREAALTPDLFRDLHSSHSDASEDAIKSYLILKKGFLESGARLAASAYRDTLSLAKPPDSGYSEGEQERRKEPLEEEPKTLGRIVMKEMERGATQGEALAAAAKRFGAPLLTQTLVVSIPRNFKVDFSVHGDEIKKEDLAKIKSQFNRWIEGLEEAFE